MDLKRVVVTGLGTVNPLGNSIPEFWENAIAGVSGAGPITNFDTNAIQTKVKFGCQVKNFDISEFMDRKEARKLDKYSHFAIASAVQAIKDSALDLENENLDRIGVILGFGIGGVDSFEEGVDTIHEQKKLGQELKVTPFFVPRILGSIASGLISIMYKLKGPNYATSSACASSTHAIIDAVNMIRLGKANVIVTGGAEAERKTTARDFNCIAHFNAESLANHLNLFRLGFNYHF